MFSKVKKVLATALTLSILSTSGLVAHAGTIITNYTDFSKKAIQNYSGQFTNVASGTKGNSTYYPHLKVTKIYDSSLVDKTDDWTYVRAEIRSGSSATSTLLSDANKQITIGVDTNITTSKYSKGDTLYLFAKGNSSSYAAYITGRFTVE